MLRPSSPVSPDGPGSAPDLRYRRNIDVPGLGEVGQARLRAARVLVVGAGGLGSPVLVYLAAAGIGTLGIADGDVVEVSNLQRQVIHPEAAVGTNKAASAARRLADLNSEVAFEVIEEMVRAETAVGLFARYDLVLDCCDTFAAKLMLADAAQAAGVPLVWGSAVSMQGQVSVFGVPDETGRRWTLRDLVPVEPERGTYPLAVDVGVLGAMVGQVGSVMATEAIKLLAGFGQPLAGRVLILDAAAGRWDVVALGRTP